MIYVIPQVDLEFVFQLSELSEDDHAILVGKRTLRAIAGELIRRRAIDEAESARILAHTCASLSDRFEF